MGRGHGQLDMPADARMGLIATSQKPDSPRDHRYQEGRGRGTRRHQDKGTLPGAHSQDPREPCVDRRGWTARIQPRQQHLRTRIEAVAYGKDYAHCVSLPEIWPCQVVGA